MYLTDSHENTLGDVITNLEPDLFRTVTGLTVEDFGATLGNRVLMEARAMHTAPPAAERASLEEGPVAPTASGARAGGSP